MLFDVISSGSSGNATIIIANKHVLLLDFGISKKRINLALKSYGYSFDDIEACFLTHTHSDHASDAFNMPLEKLYSTSPRVPKIKELITGDHLIKPYQTISFDEVKVTSLPLSHDAPNTMAYLINDGKEELLYLVDTGFVPEKNFPYLKNKDYYIFESNHDPKMLYESKRPDYLIRRIISDTGHLSNFDSAYYLSNFIENNTKEIVLAHLSLECNNPSIAITTFESVLQTQLGYIPDVKVTCASDKVETKGGRE